MGHVPATGADESVTLPLAPQSATRAVLAGVCRVDADKDIAAVFATACRMAPCYLNGRAVLPQRETAAQRLASNRLILGLLHPHTLEHEDHAHGRPSHRLLRGDAREVSPAVRPLAAQPSCKHICHLLACRAVREMAFPRRVPATAPSR